MLLWHLFRIIAAEKTRIAQKKMSNNSVRDKIDYIVMLIDKFAKFHNMAQNEACHYLTLYKGLDLCDSHYGIMHTLPLNDNLNDLLTYCRRNGGSL